MKMVKCSIKFCMRNASTDIGISFFRFPAESARCDEWMIGLGRPDLQGVNADKLHQSKYRVCGVHFHNTSFSSMLLNRLKKDAIPINFPFQARPGPYFECDANELEKLKSSLSENIPKVVSKEDDEDNEKSNDANDGEQQLASEKDEIKQSDQQPEKDTDKQMEDMQESTKENSQSESLADTEVNNALEKKNSDGKQSENDESKVSEKTEDSKNTETSENENSVSEEACVSQKEGSEQTEIVQNGISEESSKDDDKRMETDENEDDDDDDFNPLLLCPDISMDVDESPVLTESAGHSQVNDDSNALFAPLFSTFVDEMTGAEISFNLTAEEQQLREKLYGPNNPIQFSKIHCTACNVHLGSALAGQTNRFVHPLLKVLICKECYHFYTSGEFEKDEDGSELYCRWCGQGGQVLCCTMCEFVFCKKCIRINFGRKKLTQVRDSDDWKCFRCDISQLKTLRAMCVEFFEYVRKETARASTYTDSDIVNKDLTNCCQPANRKRQMDGEKEPEKEVVKRPKRRKNEEDPDYNPYVQEKEDRSNSPVPSTSGVKVATNAIKTTPLGTQSKASTMSEVNNCPTTVRIGNQILNLKNVGGTQQLVGASSPSVVRNTAVRAPVPIRPKTCFAPRTAIPPANVRSTAAPAVGSLAQIRASSGRPQGLSQPVMKHEWFEKTVRAAARVNSNLSYTLTQLNKAQSSASSVEQLAVVHNKLQEILSSSINSLIQIRKNLRTEFIAGIKTIRFPPKKPIVDPNDDDVIIINPEPTPTMRKPATPVIKSNNSATTSNTPPSKGYLKVRSFSQLQNVSSECITIPDDDPPPLTIIKPVVKMNEKNKDPADDTSKENKEKEIPTTTKDDEKNEKVVEEKIEVEILESVEGENVSEKEDKKADEESPTSTESEKKESTDNKNAQTKNGDRNGDCNKEKNKNKELEVDNSVKEMNGNGTDSSDSTKCNGDVTEGEVKVKSEPEEKSYNINEQPTPKIRRMLSVKVNLKKSTAVENLVKQEPVENGDK